MTEFDPDSSDVRPNGRKTHRASIEQNPGEKQSNQTNDKSVQDRKTTALAIINSRLTLFLGLWALITVLLVQIIKLFNQNFSFTTNYTGIMAITFIIAAGFRYLAAQKLNIAGVVAVGVVLDRLWRPIRGLLGTAWTFLLLGFILVFVSQCSQNPNMPVENLFFVSLDTYRTWLGQFWLRLLWYLGWS